MKYLVIFLIAFVGSLVASDVQAQRPQHITSNSCTWHRIPPVTNIPPYHGDMNLDEFLGYLYLDSLCRSLTSRDQLNSLANQIANFDTLRRFLKYDYILKNYNSKEFYDYLLFALDQKPSYKVSPMGVITTMETRALDILPDSQQKYLMLASAATVLHVRVIGTWTDIDTVAVSYDPFRMVCVNAQVLDTIKGRHLDIDTCDDGTSPYLVIPSCFKFMYPPIWEKGPGPFGGIQLAVRDSAGWPINCSTCYGKDAFIPGQEYIVVLKNLYSGYDGVNALHNYVPYNYLEPSGGVFPIVQGDVIDPYDFWGYGQSVPIQTFKANLQQDINLLLQP